MKTFLLIAILIIPLLNANAQQIGELAEEKEPIIFPDNTFGLDIMFSEGGFGLGGFYRRQITSSITVFGDISFSEYKEDNEFQYYDYFGNPLQVPFKVNRIFLIPLNLGMQYRIFENVIYDNLRPYINVGVGPTLVMTTPSNIEFFSAFGHAKSKLAIGSYIGFGANFGLDKSSLVGINLRYYFVHMFDEGVVSIINRRRADLGGFYLTINLGLMY